MGQVIQRQAANSQTNADGTTWWCRMFARIVGSVSGFFAIFLGIWACFTIEARCIGAGLLQMLAGLGYVLLRLFGFLVIAMEAPCLCMWFDFIEKLNAFSESRKYYQKAVVYGVFGTIPLIVCFGFSTFFGSGLICVSATVYGMMAFGAKADRESMMAAAGPNQPGAAAPAANHSASFNSFGSAPATPTTDAWDAGLVSNEKNHQQAEHNRQFP